MSPQIIFFIRESIAFARTLPYSQCLKYLRGLLEACGDLEAVCDVRDAVYRLEQTDAQLELLASGQLRFGLDKNRIPPHRRPGRKGTE